MAMKNRLRIIVVVIVLIVAVIGVAAFRRTRTDSSQKAGSQQTQRPAIPVLAAAATNRDMPVYLRGLGTVTAYYTVTVKTRVDGQLMKVNFREGQEVKEGDVLAIIDPRPFEVQLHQAEATLAKDQAQMTDAKVNLDRFQALFKEGVIAKQQLDTQGALVGQFEGTIAADRAQIENARLQLVYSRVTAPISGRIGLRLVDPGNIVHASDANGMLVITQLQPIAVIFTLPADYIPQVLSHMRDKSLNAEAYSRDDTTKIATGKLLTLNNEIDPTTGTNRFKAVFQNEQRLLWPNQFVNMRLLLDVKKNALVIPAAGVQHGNQGTYVYVVKPDKTVEMRSIKVGFTEANLVDVDAGLNTGELVVTDGQDKLQPGMRVEVQQGNNGPGRQGQGAGQVGQGGQGQAGAQGAQAEPQSSPPGSQTAPQGNPGRQQGGQPQGRQNGQPSGNP
jgi:membrane fusion protein, multidrug efflux system